MKEKYEALFNALSKEAHPLLHEQFTKPMDIPYLTSFTSIEGKHYFDEKNKRVRFMLVGRAVNGWAEKRYYGSELTLEEFVNSSLANFQTDISTVTEAGKDRFEWIKEVEAEGVAPHNTYRPGIDTSKLAITEEPYTLSRPIWNYPMRIWCKLTGMDTNLAWKNRWFENIVWSNLYKIAPSTGGNPSKKLMDAEFDACADLLLAEIDKYEPTHILFATGYKGWFDRFDEKYGGICTFSLNYEEKKIYAEAWGTINGAKFVVAKRPERAELDKYVPEIASAFDNF